MVLITVQLKDSLESSLNILSKIPLQNQDYAMVITTLKQQLLKSTKTN